MYAIRSYYEYGYSEQNIRQFVPVQMGVSKKEADIIVYNDKQCLSPYIVIECKKEDISELEFRNNFVQHTLYEVIRNEQVDIVVKKTNDNLDMLHQSTTNAQKAIEINDQESLKEITSELIKMKKQINFLQKELFSDPLTGAYNRRWFSDYYLQDERFQNDGFIAFIDLDKFKRINDKYGHIIGDQVLKYLVKFLA